MTSEIVSGILIGLYNIIVDFISHASKETVNDHIEKNTLIQERLQDLLNTLGASRIYIRLYHNGGTYYTSMPQQKNSCVYEVVNKGIMPIMSENQNKLVSESPILHSTVSNNKEFEVYDMENLTDEALKLKYLNRGVKSVYIRGLWDINTKLVGLLCVDYNYECYKITNEEKEKIIDFCKIMTGYLAPANSSKITGWIAGIILTLLCTAVLSSVMSFVYFFFLTIKLLGY